MIDLVSDCCSFLAIDVHRFTREGRTRKGEDMLPWSSPNPLRPITDAINKLSSAEAIRSRSDQIDGLIQVNGALYDRASTYTTLILAAGYAAFFTVWSASGSFS